MAWGPCLPQPHTRCHGEPWTLSTQRGADNAASGPDGHSQVLAGSLYFPTSKDHVRTSRLHFGLRESQSESERRERAKGLVFVS